MQDDGNLTAYDTQGKPIWASNTEGGNVNLKLSQGQRIPMFNVDVLGIELSEDTKVYMKKDLLKCKNNCNSILNQELHLLFTEEDCSSSSKLTKRYA